MGGTLGRAIVALVVALAMAVAMPPPAGVGAPAAGGDSPCDGYPLRWTRAKALAQIAESRAEVGFRRDEAYLARQARRVRRDGRVTWIVPYTRAERAYMAARRRLARVARIAGDYLRREAPDASGGVSIEDAWPAPAYVRAHLTRDVERHVAAIRARLDRPDVVQGLLVERSERDLRALQSRVNADWERLGSQGLHVLSAFADPAGNVVVIELWSPRADAAEALLARYGPGIRVDVVAETPTYDECAGVSGYRPSRGGRILRITWEHSGSVRLARVGVRETAGAVTVGVVARVPRGALTADLRIRAERIRLRRPLGRRVVIDAGDGARVPCRSGCRFGR